MVQLAQTQVIWLTKEQFYFNSTMVQLAQNENKKLNYYFEKFQFHYGSISSRINLYINGKEVKKFQFHYGSISSNVAT